MNRYVARWGGLACLDDREARRGGTWDDEKQNAVDKLLTRQIGRSPEWAIDQLGYQCLNTMFMVNVFDASDVLTCRRLASRRCSAFGR